MAYKHFVFVNNNWVEKEWLGFSKFTGNDVWTDGTNIYYSANQTYLIK